jgi:hypothetical protein
MGDHQKLYQSMKRALTSWEETFQNEFLPIKERKMVVFVMWFGWSYSASKRHNDIFLSFLILLELGLIWILFKSRIWESIGVGWPYYNSIVSIFIVLILCGICYLEIVHFFFILILWSCQIPQESVDEKGHTYIVGSIDTTMIKLNIFHIWKFSLPYNCIIKLSVRLKDIII